MSKIDNRQELTVLIYIHTVLFFAVGAIMEEMAKRLLNLEKCKFEPGHKNNLANDFKCYANYDLDLSIE